LDNKYWTELASNTYTPSIKSGEKIYFKNVICSSNKGKFYISKKCNVGGDIMSLAFGDAY
jgi:hypothetical protein